MFTTTITRDTAAAGIRLRLRDPRTNAIVEDLGELPPKYLQQMTHTINAQGEANNLLLTLYHHIDFYDTRSSADEKNPSYIVSLINRGAGLIEFQYGYIQGTQDLSPSFKLLITNVQVDHQKSGIVYVITAVSYLSAVAGMSVDGYNWFRDPQYRLAGIKSYRGASINFSELATAILQQKYASNNVTYYDYDMNAPIMGVPEWGYKNVKVIEEPDTFVVLDEPHLYQEQVSDLTFLRNLLNPNTGIVKKTVSKTVRKDSETGQTTYSKYTYLTGYMLILDDSTSTATIRPTQKVTYENDALIESGTALSQGDMSVSTKYSYVWNSPKGWVGDNSVSSDIIHLNLMFDAIGQMYATSITEPTYGVIDPNGELISAPSSAAIAGSGSITSALNNWIKSLTSYLSVAGKFPIFGEITVRGEPQIVGALTTLKIIPYINGIPTITAGYYWTLNKVDTIDVTGRFTTTYSLMKQAGLKSYQPGKIDESVGNEVPI